MSPDDIHGKLMNLQEENQKLKKTSVSIQDVERLIEENRKMKMEIHKLQMTQYASSDFDSKSQRSFQKSNNQFPSADEINNKVEKGSGFQLPNDNVSPRASNRNRSSGNSTLNSSQYNPTNTNSSLIRAGKNLVNNDASTFTPNQKAERRKEKQKILDKLEQL